LAASDHNEDFAPKGRNLNSLGRQPQVGESIIPIKPGRGDTSPPSSIGMPPLSGLGEIGPLVPLGLAPQAIQITPLRGTRKAPFDVTLEKVAVLAILTRMKAEQGAEGGREVAMKKVAISEIKGDLPKYLRIASTEDVVITDEGKPAGVLIGFESEDDWFDYQLENDPRFLRSIEEARQQAREGQGVRLEDIEE
jgi:prevent-host-death family protein